MGDAIEIDYLRDEVDRLKMDLAAERARGSKMRLGQYVDPLRLWLDRLIFSSLGSLIALAVFFLTN